MSYQRGFKIGGGGLRPGGGHDAVHRVLLLWVDMLHVERRVELGLGLRWLGIHAVVHAPVSVLCKERVDCLYPRLLGIKVHWKEINKGSRSLEKYE